MNAEKMICDMKAKYPRVVSFIRFLPYDEHFLKLMRADLDANPEYENNPSSYVERFDELKNNPKYWPIERRYKGLEAFHFGCKSMFDGHSREVQALFVVIHTLKFVELYNDYHISPDELSEQMIKDDICNFIDWYTYEHKWAECMHAELIQIAKAYIKSNNIQF